MTTILILISRPEYLNLVFAGLEHLICDADDTSILAIVDGDSDLYELVRNKVEQSKFKERLTVQYKATDKMKRYDMAHRRKRIGDIHNFAREYVKNTEYIFGIEDDTTFGPGTLDKLQQDYRQFPFAGMIQGCQVGRWGIPYYGAWKVNNVYNPTEIQSLERGKGIEACDAGGFFCFITRAEYYFAVEHQPFDNGGLGPDVNYGVELRKQGLMNYTDWDVPCDHHTKDGVIKASEGTYQVKLFKNVAGRWRQKTDEVANI